MTFIDESESIPDRVSPETIVIPINGVIDLHTFDPRELNDLLNDYLEACMEKSIFHVKIIHGKGSGILQKRVWSILKKHPMVENFGFAPLEAGSWGATIARLKK